MPRLENLDGIPGPDLRGAACTTGHAGLHLLAVRLRLIGYWRSEGGDQPWPDPHDFVDWSWDEQERRRVVRYLSSSGMTRRIYRGRHGCRLCDQWQGAVELTDGVYVWPGGLAHYLEAHGVRLPDEFVRHVASRLAELGRATTDTSWWRAQTPLPGSPITTTPGTDDADEAGRDMPPVDGHGHPLPRSE